MYVLKREFKIVRIIRLQATKKEGNLHTFIHG